MLREAADWNNRNPLTCDEAVHGWEKVRRARFRECKPVRQVVNVLAGARKVRELQHLAHDMCFWRNELSYLDCAAFSGADKKSWRSGNFLFLFAGRNSRTFDLHRPILHGLWVLELKQI